MADIYAFPTGAPNEGHPERPQGVPDDVWAAVESVSAMKRLYDVRYREIPVPSTLADYGIGVELEAGERMDSHPFAAPGMYWEDMCDYLGEVEPDSISGTVTVTQNTTFGLMAGSTSAGCEIRVSWTPLDGTGPGGTMDAGAQVNSWAAFIRSTTRREEDDAS